jgi:hypothetical protein
MAPRKATRTPAKPVTRSATARKQDHKNSSSGSVATRVTGSKRGTQKSPDTEVPETPTARVHHHKASRQQGTTADDAVVPLMFRTVIPSSPSAKPIDRDSAKPVEKSALMSDVQLGSTSTSAAADVTAAAPATAQTQIQTQVQPHVPPSVPVSLETGNKETKVTSRGDVTPTPINVASSVSQGRSSNPEGKMATEIVNTYGKTKTVNQSVDISDDDNDCVPLHDLDVRF